MNLASYRKAVVAMIGAAAIVLPTIGVAVGPDVDDAVIGLYDSVVALLTALGVHQVPNDA